MNCTDSVQLRFTSSATVHAAQSTTVLYTTNCCSHTASPASAVRRLPSAVRTATPAFHVMTMQRLTRHVITASAVGPFPCPSRPPGTRYCQIPLHGPDRTRPDRTRPDKVRGPGSPLTKSVGSAEWNLDITRLPARSVTLL